MDEQPFITFRSALDTYTLALAAGFADDRYCELVTELDSALTAAGGVGFRTTPLIDVTVDSTQLLVKVETANVGGSHKARHLFGLLVQIMIEERTQPDARGRSLAIASCGNAAVGAAVVARAVDRELVVFVPADADPLVLTELERLGADIRICERDDRVLGDPCVAGLDAAVRAGARPFTVQGTICPGVIDGGRTLGLELASQLADAGVVPTDLYIQIGGGALATATVDGLIRSERMQRLPRLHPVQALAAHPYVAGWRRARSVLCRAFGLDPSLDDRALATALSAVSDGDRIDTILAATDPFAQPWPGQPASVAGGILDDITYDGATVLAHQIRTGGWPVLVSEPDFVACTAHLAERFAARGIAQPPADATGAAGFAGFCVDHLRGDDGPVVVIASGRARSSAEHHA